MSASTCNSDDTKDITVNLYNCRNLDKASFSLSKGRLNIKFAPNGTGKSSIASGIHYAIMKEESERDSIVPFKYRSESDEHPFSSEGLESFKNVALFNEDYVSKVVFQDNQTVTNGFDVFVKTNQYDRTILRLTDQVKEVKNALSNDAIRQLRQALEVYIANTSGKNGVTKSKQLKANTPTMTALEKGNIRATIPTEFQYYQSYIKGEQFSDWSTWVFKGLGFIDKSTERCPFCGQPVKERIGTIESLSENYTSKIASGLDKVRVGLASVEPYLKQEVFKSAESVYLTKSSITDAQSQFVAGIVNDANTIIAELSRGSSLDSFFELTKVESLEEYLGDCIVDFQYINSFDSPTTRECLLEYNEAVRLVQESAGELVGIINAQKDALAKSIKGSESTINMFLSKAGYPYSVDIVVDNDGGCAVKLFHQTKYLVQNVREALSYGERNALSLMFFMFDSIRKESDLIILDDPISSFDGHKRFAILDMLFLNSDLSENKKNVRKHESLKNMTVLMLTHDYGVVFDIEHTLKSEFQPTAQTTFLYQLGTTLVEKQICAGDMIPVRKLYKSLMTDSKSREVRLIYLRKELELDDTKDIVWDVLSSVFHRRKVPTDIHEIPIPEEELPKAYARISNKTDFNFNYDEIVAKVRDSKYMEELFHNVKCNYEKLQIARVILDGVKGDRVLKKYADETVHVENGYIFQLDPRQFEVVPSNIVERCKELIIEMNGNTNTID